MVKTLNTMALVLFLSACGYVDAYEEAVYEQKPVYCYKTLAAVQCFKEPQHFDQQRLVNYYGPHPSRNAPPDAVAAPELRPPTNPAAKWVKDPEPVPQPRVRVRGILRNVGLGQPLPKSYRTTLDEETATELKALRITEPVAAIKSNPVAAEPPEQ